MEIAAGAAGRGGADPGFQEALADGVDDALLGLRDSGDTLGGSGAKVKFLGQPYFEGRRTAGRRVRETFSFRSLIGLPA